MEFYNSFGEDKPNNRKGENIAIVFSSKENLVQPKKEEIEFTNKYLSLSLHAYVSKISKEDIVGIIVDKYNKLKIEKYLIENQLNIEIWEVEKITKII